MKNLNSRLDMNSEYVCNHWRSQGVVRRRLRAPKIRAVYILTQLNGKFCACGAIFVCPGDGAPPTLSGALLTHVPPFCRFLATPLLVTCDMMRIFVYFVM